MRISLHIIKVIHTLHMQTLLQLKQVDFKNSKDIQLAFSFLKLNANVSPLFNQYKSIIDKLPNVAVNCIGRYCAEATSKYPSGMQFIKYNNEVVGIIGFFVKQELYNQINKAELSVFLAPEFIGGKNGVSIWKVACQNYLELLARSESDFNPQGEFVSKYIETNKVSQHIQKSLGILKASSGQSSSKCGDSQVITLTGTFKSFFKNVVYPAVQMDLPRL